MSRRTHCLSVAPRQSVQPGSARLGECPGVLARRQHLWQQISQLPGQVLRREQGVESGNHIGVVIQGGAVDGEHAAGFPDSHSIDAGEGIVDVSGKGGQVGNPRNMLLPVEHRLIQMGDRPPLGNMKAEKFRQCCCGGAGNGVLPCTEGREQVPVLVEGQIAVHHS